MNKVLLLISIDGSYVGGAQKRYLSLFNFLSEKRNDYFLVINKRLYQMLVNNNVLKSFKNVRILNLYSENKNNLIEEFSNTEQNDLKKFNKTIKPGIRLFLGKIKMFLKSLIIWISFVFEFRKILNELKCKNVYAIYTGGIFAWPLKSLFKFKLIYSYNDSAMNMIDKNIFELFNSSEYWVLKKADKIDFLSQGIVEMYKNKIGLIKNSRYSVTPNSFIDYQIYFPDSRKENNVIFLSRLWSNKNPILFLNSIKIFNDKYKERDKINFYIIGEGDLEDDINKYIISHTLTNTKFLGKTLKPWEYLRKSKVFVSLQQINNYPSQSLMEAMACENAIIASDVGETRKLVSDNEGVLVNLNPESISKAIYKLFSTDGLIEQLGTNARKKVINEHTVEKFAEYFYSITDI